MKHEGDGTQLLAPCEIGCTLVQEEDSAAGCRASVLAYDQLPLFPGFGDIQRPYVWDISAPVLAPFNYLGADHEHI